MRHSLAISKFGFLFFLLVGTCFGQQKTIISTVPFQDVQGNPIAGGTLVLQLPADARITTGGGQIAPKRVVKIQLTAGGVLPANTLIWASDQLTPTNMAYLTTLYDQNGNIVYGPERWLLAGTSPIDVSQLTPTSASVSYPSLIYLNQSNTWTAMQIFTGGITVTGGGSLDGTFGGNPTFSGTVTFSETPVFLDGASFTGTISGSPTFSGTPNFSNGFFVSGNIGGNPTFTGTPVFSNGGALSGTFTGSPIFSGSVDFTGSVTFPPNSIPVVDLVAGTNGQCMNTTAGAAVWGPCTGLVIQTVKKTGTCQPSSSSSYDACTDVLTWSNGGFADTNYMPVCTGVQPSASGLGASNNYAPLLIISSYSMTTITVITQQERGATNYFTEISCVGFHP